MATKKESATPEEAIEAAMATATLASGASSLPSAGEVPPAFATGRVISSDILLPSDASMQAGMNLELAGNPYCSPAAKMQAEQIAGALATQAPAAPPAQVAVGAETINIPSTVRTYPHRLHSQNATRAKALWTAFTGDEHRATLAKLAAQAGHSADPFVYLAQALIALIEIDNWYPTKQADTPDFNPAEKDPQHSTRQGLIEWAGPDLARLIVRDSERLNISIIGVLQQMYSRLDEKKQEQLRKIQLTETSQQWAE